MFISNQHIDEHLVDAAQAARTRKEVVIGLGLSKEKQLLVSLFLLV